MKTGNNKTGLEDAGRLHAYCARCRHPHVFVRTETNHGVHLLLSVATLGVWLVSWASACIGNIFQPWRCEHCGWHKPESIPLSDAEEKMPAEPNPSVGDIYGGLRTNA